MKTSFATVAVVLANVLGASAALDTMAEYMSDIPDCALSSFRKIIKSEGCGSTDFDCLCRHMSAVAVEVGKDTSSQCSADFAQAIGSVCGVWLVDGTTASDYPEATSILAKDLDGSSGSSDKTDSASGSSATATDSAAAATASSTKSDSAAAATMGPGLVGIMGAAAVAALL